MRQRKSRGNGNFAEARKLSTYAKVTPPSLFLVSVCRMSAVNVDISNPQRSPPIRFQLLRHTLGGYQFEPYNRQDIHEFVQPHGCLSFFHFANKPLGNLGELGHFFLPQLILFALGFSALRPILPGKSRPPSFTDPTELLFRHVRSDFAVSGQKSKKTAQSFRFLARPVAQRLAVPHPRLRHQSKQPPGTCHRRTNT